MTVEPGRGLRSTAFHACPIALESAPPIVIGPARGPASEETMSRILAARALLPLALLLAASLGRAAAPAAPRLPSDGEVWVRVRSENFVVLSNGAGDRAELVARGLERLHATLGAARDA